MSKGKTQKVLVTGGAGFIGSHLCEELLHRGFHVTAVDNHSTSTGSNLRGLLKEKSRFSFHKASILDEAVMNRLIRGVGTVYHLAASVGVKYTLDYPTRTILNNLHGAETVLRVAARHQTRVFLASSSEVYGQQPNWPIHEEAMRILGPTSVIRWHYAVAKSMDESLAHAYHMEQGLPVIVGRFFNTVGPRQRGRYGMVFPRLISSALRNEPMTVFGTGNQCRTFNYVLDTVRAVVDLSLTAKALGKVFNVGSDRKAVSIAELARRIKKRLGSKSKIVKIPYQKFYGRQFEDIRFRTPDLTRLKKTIHYKTAFDLDDMIDETAAWLKRHRARF